MAAAYASSLGFEVQCGPVEEMLKHSKDGFFDVIISSMVLEHLFNPFEVVRQIARKLKPGGLFLFSTVVRDSLDAWMYGPYWSGFDFPRHMVHFRKQDVRDMVKDYFDVQQACHQSASIDFVRPASWRGRPVDNILKSAVSSKLGNSVSALLSLLSLTSRVSFRCALRRT